MDQKIGNSDSKACRGSASTALGFIASGRSVDHDPRREALVVVRRRQPARSYRLLGAIAGFVAQIA
jgi:hypothetical protein